MHYDIFCNKSYDSSVCETDTDTFKANLAMYHPLETLQHTYYHGTTCSIRLVVSRNKYRFLPNLGQYRLSHN